MKSCQILLKVNKYSFDLSTNKSKQSIPFVLHMMCVNLLPCLVCIVFVLVILLYWFFLSQCYQNILISHTSSVFMIYVRKNEWFSGKPKAVRVRPNNNDSEVAKQPKRRITLDIGHRTFGAQSLWLFHLTHHLDKIHLKSLVLYFDKITCN